jgi:hypothetical protein
MDVFYIEVILVIINILFWLGPLLKSIRKGIFNPLHPQFITPFWIIYFILNTMIQNWYPWMGGSAHGILKTTGKAIIYDPYYLIKPLIIVALCAPSYHLGVRLFCGSIVSSASDKEQFNKVSSVVPRGQKIPFVLLAFIISGIVWLPNYIIPNAGYGTFWTYPLAMTNAILPFMIFCVNKPIGLLSFGFVIASALVMRSKASFLYPVLSIIFYYSFLRFSFRKLKSWIMLFVALGLAVLALSFGFGSDARRLLHRDYSFETFAALVDKTSSYFGNAESSLVGESNGPYASWTAVELAEGVPSILYPNKRYTVNPAKMVSRSFLPEDYKSIPNAYFNRFLLFAGYYDLGIIGACLSALIFGSFYGWFWKKTKQKVFRSGYLWPLFIYLPIPTIGSYFIACGGLTYGLINALVPAGVLWVIVIVTRWGMQAVLNGRRASANQAGYKDI